MRFEPFQHAALLAKAWQSGAPRHNLGASGFQPDAPLAGLPDAVEPDDLAAFDLHAATPFRDAVARHLGLQPEQVCPAAGTSAANLSLVADHARPGTNVVCERPYYAPMPSLAKGLGATLRFVERGGDGALDGAALAGAMDDRTSLVLLTSPNNPTGHAADARCLLEVAAAADAHDAVVLVDQVYRELTDHPLAAGLHPRLVSTGSMNKCWGAPGLRAGWIAGDPAVVAAAEENHRTLVLGPSRIGTRIGTALLAHATPRRHAMEARLARTHRIFETWARGNGLPVRHGALTAFVPAPVDDTMALADALSRRGILVLPGEVFGRPGHLRIGLGIQPDALAAALAALSDALLETGVGWKAQ